MNSGRVILGNFGSSDRFQYTVLGDEVNLASRLEGANRNYGTTILFSEHTRGALFGQVNLKEVDAVQIDGKRDPVKIYTVVSEESQQPLSPDEKTHG